MRIEINQLEQFNRLASRGARHSASSLTQLTGLQIRDEMTSVSLVTESVLEETFSGHQYVGVQVGLDGGLSGETVLILEPDSAAQIKRQIPGVSGAGSMSGSAFAEIGNIMIGGFVDGWANHLGVTVDITPPTYLEATGTRILPRLTRREAAAEGVFLFQSQLEAKDTDLSVPMFLIPEYDEFVSLLAGRSTGPTVPAEKLTIFNDFAEQSAERASQQIAMLTGLSTDVDVSQLRFMSLSEMASNIGRETHVGSVFEMDGLPSGYFLLLFDLASAKSVASAMMPGDGEVDDSMMKPAIEELGNILTSGFVDGWANTLQTKIEHSPPEYVHDTGENVIRDIVDRLDGDQESAFTIDSAIEIGGRETQCRIYVLPDRDELTRALEQIPGA
ncbi:MAG: chemotaxis protein CheC [Halohasta sp.]